MILESIADSEESIMKKGQLKVCFDIIKLRIKKIQDNPRISPTKNREAISYCTILKIEFGYTRIRYWDG